MKKVGDYGLNFKIQNIFKENKEKTGIKITQPVFFLNKIKQLVKVKSDLGNSVLNITKGFSFLSQ